MIALRPQAVLSSDSDEPDAPRGMSSVQSAVEDSSSHGSKSSAANASASADQQSISKLRSRLDTQASVLTSQAPFNGNFSDSTVTSGIYVSTYYFIYCTVTYFLYC